LVKRSPIRAAGRNILTAFRRSPESM
jgi:hypothetical protein